MMIYLFVYVSLSLVLIKVTYESTAVTSKSLPAETIMCGNITCANKAMCRNHSNGQPFCFCHRGFEGKTCEEDIEECTFGSPCYHRGHCHNTFGSYRCECLDGWLGEDVHCEIKDNSTTDRKCMPGWIGEWCQDQCLNDSMCRDTEVCKMRGRGHRCVCAAGWHGVNCTSDIDECLRHPCPDNYECSNIPGSYKCLCRSGWMGMNCDEDINECLTNPCKHSSICTNVPGFYNCTCEPGWEGEDCEEDIDECINNPCNTSLQCVNSQGSYSCISLLKQETSDEDKTYIIVCSVIGPVLLVFFAGILLIIIKVKRKANKCNAANVE